MIHWGIPDSNSTASQNSNWKRSVLRFRTRSEAEHFMTVSELVRFATPAIIQLFQNSLPTTLTRIIIRSLQVVCKRSPLNHPRAELISPGRMITPFSSDVHPTNAYGITGIWNGFVKSMNAMSLRRKVLNSDLTYLTSGIKYEKKQRS